MALVGGWFKILKHTHAPYLLASVISGIVGGIFQASEYILYIHLIHHTYTLCTNTSIYTSICATQALVGYTYIQFCLNISPCPHQIEFDCHCFCSCLARDLASRLFIFVMPALIRDYVRVCGTADRVFFSIEYSALHCAPAIRVFANGLRFTRLHFVTA